MMRPHRFYVLALGFVCANAALAQQPDVRGIPRPAYVPGEPADSVIAKLDQWLVKMSIVDSASGVVAIMGGAPRQTYIRAFGLADRRSSTPNGLDTRFTLASMGKMFTAVSIAQLVDAGKLALTDTLGKFLPGYPNADARRVSIAQLLYHSSGFGTYWNDRYSERRSSLMTLSDYVPLFSSDSLQFTPGTRFGYSNAGYIMLGRIVEVVSGMSYYDYVKRNVFDKAGMRNTGYYDKTGTAPNAAVGYYREARDGSGPLRDNLDQRELRGSSAGGGYSTAADMVAFLGALMGDRLMSTKIRALFTAAKGDGPFGPNSYGYGFMMRNRGDTVLAIGHTGGFPGMTTQAFYYLRSKVSLVVLLNQSSPGGNAVMSEAARAAGLIGGQ